VVSDGAMVSRLIVTDCDAVPPWLVAVHVSVCDTVSLEMVVVVQPVDAPIALSPSATVQLTITSLRYQPFDPRVPLTFGVIDGGVESVNVTFTVNDAELE